MINSKLRNSLTLYDQLQVMQKSEALIITVTLGFLRLDEIWKTGLDPRL